MINNIFIMCGPAGCGKSTWIEQNKIEPCYIISRDKIRFNILNQNNTNQYFKYENIVKKEFFEAIYNATAILHEINIYIDATHLTEKSRRQVISYIADKDRWTINFVNFNITLEICLAQNAKRDGLARVPDGAIKSMFNSYEPANYEEYNVINVNKISPKIYITSDTHFMHDKDFLYAPRGFNTSEGHDKQIIKNWNLVVSKEDTVYHLGDIGMGTDIEKIASYVNQLNGKIYWIRGNHDTDNKVKYLKEHCPNIIQVTYAEMIKYKKYTFYLSHYPTAVGNYDDELKHNKFYSLCGHTHTKDKFLDFNNMKSYHVELDAHNNFPVDIDNIIEDIKNKINIGE